MQIKTSRGLAPLPSFFTPLYELAPRFIIEVSTGVVETHTKLPDGSLRITVPDNFWSTVHVTFDSSHRARSASAVYTGVNLLQFAVTKALLTLLPGETAFIYGEGILTKREAAFTNRAYRQLFFAAPLPMMAIKSPLELIALIVRN